MQLKKVHVQSIEQGIFINQGAFFFTFLGNLFNHKVFSDLQISEHFHLLFATQNNKVCMCF